MGWNPEKWVSFTSPYLNQPKPVNISEKYSEAVKEDEANHEENIDTDALGVQRAKEYLRDLASITPGSTGLVGPPGTPTTASSLILLESRKQSLSGAGPSNIITHVFAPNDLNGTKDLIKVGLFSYNIGVKVTWNGTNLFSALAANLGNGYVDIWIAQTTYNGTSNRVISRSVGVSTYNYSTAVGVDWMSSGGTLIIQMSPTNILLPWGASATLYKLKFPKVTVE